jgi:hypothetical protein
MASMSILDDAIREHLELKRAHGADESELKRLEDEAFGPPGRPEEPDPLAEAPTEFMATPGAEAATEAPDESGRRINIADLQEAPPEPAAEAPPVPAEDPAQAAPPAEEAPAAEHEAIAEVPDTGPSTEERHVIADQPTEFFDVQAELGTEDAPPAKAPSPSDEEIAEVEAAEPKLAPVEPPTEIHATRTETPADDLPEEEEDEDFWSEQRLSDELDQALEAPLEDEDDELLAEAPPAAEPISEEYEQPAASAEPEAGAEPEAQPNYDPDTGHEDVLEDTPDFLEDAPEDDELWFEQKPPKDFDFDD